MKKLVIIGNGGFAREVEWLVERINAVTPTWDFLGFVDEDLTAPKVVGNDDFIMNYPEEIYISIGIGISKTRKKIYQAYKNNPNVKFANLVDPDVLMSNGVSFGEGNIICAGTTITVNICIGNCNIINLNCTIGHDVVIDDFVTINPGVNISGNVVLRSGANIGTGTQIIQGIQVGSSTIVGAGAVVNRDLPAYCTAVGIPAKVIKSREEVPEIYD